MSYLIDTDWVVEYLKGREPATRILDALPPEELAISLITYGELYEGIYYGRDPKRAEQGFLQFIRGLDLLPLNRSIMKEFAKLRSQLRRTGQRLDDPDLLIAATALYHDLTLFTHNRRHFSRIPP